MVLILLYNLFQIAAISSKTDTNKQEKPQLAPHNNNNKPETLVPAPVQAPVPAPAPAPALPGTVAPVRAAIPMPFPPGIVNGPDLAKLQNSVNPSFDFKSSPLSTPRFPLGSSPLNSTPLSSTPLSAALSGVTSSHNAAVLPMASAPLNTAPISTASSSPLRGAMASAIPPPSMPVDVPSAHCASIDPSTSPEKPTTPAKMTTPQNGIISPASSPPRVEPVHVEGFEPMTLPADDMLLKVDPNDYLTKPQTKALKKVPCEDDKMKFKCEYQPCSYTSERTFNVLRHHATHQEDLRCRCKIIGCTDSFVDRYMGREHLAKVHGIGVTKSSALASPGSAGKRKRKNAEAGEKKEAKKCSPSGLGSWHIPHSYQPAGIDSAHFPPTPTIKAEEGAVCNQNTSNQEPIIKPETSNQQASSPIGMDPAASPEVEMLPSTPEAPMRPPSPADDLDNNNNEEKKIHQQVIEDFRKILEANEEVTGSNSSEVNWPSVDYSNHAVFPSNQPVFP